MSRAGRDPKRSKTPQRSQPVPEMLGMCPFPGLSLANPRHQHFQRVFFFFLAQRGGQSTGKMGTPGNGQSKELPWWPGRGWDSWTLINPGFGRLWGGSEHIWCFTATRIHPFPSNLLQWDHKQGSCLETKAPLGMSGTRLTAGPLEWAGMWKL